MIFLYEEEFPTPISDPFKFTKWLNYIKDTIEMEVIPHF